MPSKRNGASFVSTGSVAFALVAVLEMTTSRDVMAQVPTAEPAQLQAQASRTIDFDIPAQPLAQALTDFGRQSGVQIAVNAVAVAGKTAGGVKGTMSAEQALRLLLGGTGVSYRFTSDNAVTVSGALDTSGLMQLDPVRVQGTAIPAQAMIGNLPPPYAGGQVATGGQLGLLGNRDVMDTPFNVSSYTAKKAQDQQAKTVQDILADEPSARFTRPPTGAGSDLALIRGFPVQAASWSFGGLYGILPAWSPMAELAERVEVLKGPSAMLNGMAPLGAIGGTVNVLPKRAPNNPLTQGTASYVSAGQVGGHVDVGRRFGVDKEFGIRFNGVMRGGQTELRYNADQRDLATLGLDYRGNGFRLSADLGYQYQYISGIAPYLSLGAGVQLPYAPSARNNPVAQPWGFQERKDAFGVLKAEIDLAESVTAYASFGVHDDRIGGHYSAITTITNFNGTASSNAPFRLSAWTSYLTAEAGVRANFNTGAIGHETAVTGTIYSQTDGYATAFATQGAFATNIYNPVIINEPNTATPTSPKTSFAGLNSLAIADTLSAAEKRIQLTVGGRLQQVSAVNYDAVSGMTTSSYNETAFSPSVALVIKPWKHVSIYGNWIQGLQQGAIVQPPFANAGTIFPPYKSTQYEVGVKVDWGTLTTTANVFQISQPSVLTDLTSNTQALNGEQINRGLELNVFGEVTRGLRFVGGVMFLNPILAKTQGGTTDGWVAAFTPQVTVNLGGEVDLPFVRGLTLTGRVVYTGAQYIDTTYPRRMMPEWTRFDAGIRYAFDNPSVPDKQLVARLNVDNVFDNNYWAGSNGSALFMFLGTPRTFRLSLTADF
ncbi:MAG: TonB-dependent receptor [Proteobacteria bacterium]|nr:TonB-dependent receptor [Pseudomonadota bacterium]